MAGVARRIETGLPSSPAGGDVVVSPIEQELNMATNITTRNPFAEVAAFDPFRDIDDLFGTRRMRSLLRNISA